MDSLHLAICDDQQAEADYLALLARRWAEERMVRLHCAVFSDAEEFLFAYAEDKSFGLLLLDIQMKEMDGMALARKLRAENAALQIAFVTGFPDFAAEGYEVSALHYLMKPVGEDKLFSLLDRATTLLSQTERSLFFQIGGETVRIPVGELMVCESRAHSTLMTTRNGVFEVHLSISEVADQAGDGFVRCHRSYLVGIRHIRRITKTDVILDNNLSVPLSRRAYDLVNQAFIRYFK